MKLTTVALTGKKGKDMEVKSLDTLAHPSIVTQAVRVYLSNQRAATAKTKTRGEVNLTKTKWFRQKGTGRARHGAQSAPIFVGGGVAHGPRGNANWKLSMSKTMKVVALRTALGLQAAEGNIRVVEGLDTVGPKTKEMAVFFDTAGCNKKATLLVVDTASENVKRAVANLNYVLLCPVDTLTTYYVARAAHIFVTPEAMEKLDKKLSKENIFTTEAKSEEKLAKLEKKSAIKKEAKTVIKRTTKKQA